mgnify:CR=1 FL=1
MNGFNFDLDYPMIDWDGIEKRFPEFEDLTVEDLKKLAEEFELDLIKLRDLGIAINSAKVLREFYHEYFDPEEEEPWILFLTNLNGEDRVYGFKMDDFYGKVCLWSGVLTRGAESWKDVG